MEAPAPPPPNMRMEAPAPPPEKQHDELDSMRDRARAMREALEGNPKQNDDFRDELNYSLPSMDPAARTETLKKVLQTATDDEFIDDLGQPLPKEKLLQIAMVAPIWSKLTPSQKKMFLEDKGVLPNGRGYISKTIIPHKTPKPKIRVVNQLGETVVI